MHAMTDQLALITGASGGIGSEIARQLAERRIGLVLLERNRATGSAFAEQLPAGTVKGVYVADLANRASLRGVVSEILAAHPKIDLLFNNAGILTESLQFSSEGNELHFEVNTLAPLQLIDLLRPALKASGRAVVVSTSAGIASRVKALSIDELVRPTAPFKKLYGPYVASKQALNVLTAALAPELQADGILLRTSDPGPVRTRLTRGAGTPMWMRAFYFLLPKPGAGARKIVGAALDERWNGCTGISISGGKPIPLPPALGTRAAQLELLAACRDRAGLMPRAAV